MDIWLNNFEDIWKRLHFDTKKAPAEKVKAWKSNSRKIIEIAKEQNIGIVADTSSGKTLMSFLVAMATKARVLFIAPQIILPTQHSNVLASITNNTCRTGIITGETKKSKRIWNKEDERFVFATPQTAWREIEKGKLDLNDFQVLIIDEFHMAVGKYEYVEIAAKANEFGLRIIGLTASPGSNFKKVAEVCQNCHIHFLKRVYIQNAPKELTKIDIPVDDLFVKLDIDFRFLLDEIKEELFALLKRRAPKELLTSKQLDSLAESIKEDTDKNSDSRFRAFKLYGMYRKIMHCYRTVIIDGYDTFLEYAKKLKTEKSASSREIVKMPEFQKIVYYARYCCFAHPKVEKLTAIIKDWVAEGKNGLIFVYQKNTAKYLSEELQKNGLRTDIITSEDSGKSHEQKKVLLKLVDRKIDIVLCTTILQMGVSVPEIDAVFHFDLPSSIIAKIQKDGRTGRIRSGSIFYLVLDHPIDITRYASLQAQLKRMHKAIDLFNERKSRKSKLEFGDKESKIYFSKTPNKQKTRIENNKEKEKQLRLF